MARARPNEAGLELEAGIDGFEAGVHLRESHIHFVEKVRRHSGEGLVEILFELRVHEWSDPIIGKSGQFRRRLSWPLTAAG
jgi:hypothetical protein